jgi:hypothetical protein
MRHADHQPPYGLAEESFSHGLEHEVLEQLLGGIVVGDDSVL